MQGWEVTHFIKGGNQISEGAGNQKFASNPF